MARPVIPLELIEADMSGEIDFFDGVPVSGLVVAHDDAGGLETVAEYAAGRPHGYWVDLAGGCPQSVIEFFEGAEHGLMAKWRDGALDRIARMQIRTEDQSREYVGGALVEDEAAAAKVRRLRELRPKYPAVELSAPELLARFEDVWPALRTEATRDPGLAACARHRRLLRRLGPE